MDGELRLAILGRDGGCVALRLDQFAGPCRDRWGRGFRRTDSLLFQDLTIDHVRGQPPVGTLAKTNEGGFGKRPPDDPQHLVTLCWHHHLNGWATGHRRLLREYLAQVAPKLVNTSPDDLG